MPLDRRIYISVRLSQGRELLEIGPDNLLLLGVGKRCLEAAQIHDTHAADLGDVSWLEHGRREVLDVRELLCIGFLHA